MSFDGSLQGHLLWKTLHIKRENNPDMMYSGGCIFVDHATVFVHIKHMINFTAMETLQAKRRTWECWCNHINLTMEFLHDWILWKRSTKVCRTSCSAELVLIIKMGLLKEASNPS